MSKAALPRIRRKSDTSCGRLGTFQQACVTIFDSCVTPCISDAHAPASAATSTRQRTSTESPFYTYSCSSDNSAVFRCPSFSSCSSSFSSLKPSAFSSSFSRSSSTGSSTEASDPLALRLLCNQSDDDMNANSPDSGFESTSPNSGSPPDYFDTYKSDDTIDDLSKSSSSSSFSSVSSPLCLIPPKPEPHPSAKDTQAEQRLACKWKGCGLDFPNNHQLHLHLCEVHVDNVKDRFSCLWENCKVYDKPARAIGWLRTHVTTHTGEKRFKCLVGGCDASFTSQYGRARHVRSHFNPVTLPKARIHGNERRCLVKRRKIKDKRKALANTHDFMDEKALGFVRESLIRTAFPVKTFTFNSENRSQCKRVCKDGNVWNLASDLRWKRDSTSLDPLHDGIFFYSRPTKRPRKNKAMD